MFADGNEHIATDYLRAAGIPQSNGFEFPAGDCGNNDCGPGTDNPDMLSVPSIMGEMGTCDAPNTDHKNGALFTDTGLPAFCQIMSMHWGVNDRESVECGGGSLGYHRAMALPARPWLLLVLLITAAALGLSGCPEDDEFGPGDDDADDISELTLAIEFARVGSDSPYPIEVLVRATTLDGQPAAGADVVLEVDRGTATSPVDHLDGTYKAIVTPAAAGVSVPIRAQVPGRASQVERVALAMAFTADHWDQPELVPGLVNTPGWEDSCEISPDGEWLIVGSYTPVDLYSCIIADEIPLGDPTDPACNTALGPYGPPERPDMPGAERIESPTSIAHECPSVGVTEAFGYALPPLAAYGFRAQADGSFRDPFVIAIEMDGCTIAPFGFTFVGSPTGSDATLLFSFDHYGDAGVGNSGNDLYWLQADLGAPLWLGRYETGLDEVPVLLDFHAVELGLDNLPYGEAAPFGSTDGIWMGSAEPGVDANMWYAPLIGSLPAGPFGTSIEVGLNTPDGSENHPFLDANRLYFSRGFGWLLSAPIEGVDPGDPGSWGEEQLELFPGGEEDLPGALLAIAEPSLAHPDDGSSWLYFVIVVAAEDGTFDAGVGRVRGRY